MALSLWPTADGEQPSAAPRATVRLDAAGFGLEVDFLVPGRGGAVALVECRAGRTVTPAMAAPMLRLAEALKSKRTTSGGDPTGRVLRSKTPDLVLQERWGLRTAAQRLVANTGPRHTALHG